MTMTIKENLERIRERVVAAAIEAGHADIGENKVREFLAKAPHAKLHCR